MKHIKLFEGFISESFSEEELTNMLAFEPLKVDIKPDSVEVIVSGNDLGYDDDQYYHMVWYPADKTVESGTFKDPYLRKFVTGNNWSEDVNTLEEFAAVVDGSAESGDWE
jgi:hypothetical protein